MSPSPSHHYCDWHWLSSSKSMIRLLPLSSLMIGMPGYWLIAMFANNLVGWTELNQHQTTRRQHSLFEFHICNNWGSGGPCLQVVVNRKRLVMLVCTVHCVPHDDLARSNALQINHWVQWESPPSCLSQNQRKSIFNLKPNQNLFTVQCTAYGTR